MYAHIHIAYIYVYMYTCTHIDMSISYIYIYMHVDAYIPPLGKAQWIKCVLHKCEDLSSSPRAHVW